MTTWPRAAGAIIMVTVAPGRTPIGYLYACWGLGPAAFGSPGFRQLMIPSGPTTRSPGLGFDGGFDVWSQVNTTGLAALPRVDRLLGWRPPPPVTRSASVAAISATAATASNHRPEGNRKSCFGPMLISSISDTRPLRALPRYKDTPVTGLRHHKMTKKKYAIRNGHGQSAPRTH